ncbi:MAG: anti-sigma factor domain-containing protein [Kineosporiaceae bacterium]
MNRPDDWADHLDPGVDDPGLGAAERERLDVVAALLRDDATWDEPPPALRASLLAAARAQAREGTGPAPVRPGPADTRHRGPYATVTPLSRRRATRWWVAVSGVAAAAALVAVLAWPREQPATLALSGTAFAPAATAAVRLEPKPAGLAIHLQVSGLPAAPENAYYAAWLRGPRGTVPIGSFHWREKVNPIDLWSGVLVEAYPELFVTLQREGEPAEPSADVVLTGRVDAG